MKLWPVCLAVATAVCAPAPVHAQDPPPDHQHMHMAADPVPSWHFMQDGVLRLMLNHQGGARGGTDLTAPDWWMGMAARPLGSGRLTLTGMFSLDPAAVGTGGYREIFQVGESLGGVPLVDRQHPHDLFMQLAAVWRVPLTARTGLTIAGGPAGEPALGPIAFMHRASAAETPLAPLSHHTFDSTHISFGVVSLAVDRGPWTVEGSVFNGREPDEHRWNVDFGALDSVSLRVWYRPSPGWALQASTGHLVDPEALEPGNAERTTVSASWLRSRGEGGFTAATVGYGVNARSDGSRHAVFGEFTRRAGVTSLFARAEAVQVETARLLGAAVTTLHDAAAQDTVGAVTVGGVRELARWRGVEAGLGAALTLYGVPQSLQATHGSRPVSFQIFLRVRPPAGPMGRMWNMRMTAP